MTKEAKQELDRKNREYLTKKRAKREVLAATKKRGKQSAEIKMTTGPKDGTVESTAKAPSKALDIPKVRTRVTLQALKARVRETWPEAKHLADAKRDEFVALLERGDAELFKQYQETWAKRSKIRYEAWLKGDSKSAQAARTKKSEQAGK